MAQKLLIATHNRGKAAELSHILADQNVDCLTLDEAGVTADVPETGRTFRQNAVLKAGNYAAMTGLLTLADDSGLEVDALDGAPGLYTARYGGQGLTHQQRYELLLENLRGVPEEERTARFRCVVALAGPDGALLGTAEGICQGRIALEPSGTGGFGYDPVFYLPDRGKTMAELPTEVKNPISHRGRALAAIAPLLEETLRRA